MSVANDVSIELTVQVNISPTNQLSIHGGQVIRSSDIINTCMTLCYGVKVMWNNI